MGAGGAVVSLGSPLEVANALRHLLTEPDTYENCSKAIRERVRQYYNKNDQCEAYNALYRQLIEIGNKSQAETVKKTRQTLNKKAA